MEKQNKNTNVTEVTTSNLEVLRKPLRELTFEDVSQNFKKVTCLLRKVSYGKGNDKTTSYTATLIFKKEVFEKSFRLNMNEYNNIVFKRNKNLTSIPTSMNITVYYLPVRSTKDGRTYCQLKVVFSSEVRKIVFLDNLEISNVDFFEVIEFLDKPEFIEEDTEAQIAEAGF